MSHNGDGFGHGTHFELFPDINLGLCMTLCGQEGGYGVRDFIAMYIGRYRMSFSSLNYQNDLSAIGGTFL